MIFSLLQGLASIGALLGCVLGKTVTDNCGRKASLLVVALPYFIGYLAITYSQFIVNETGYMVVLFGGRFISGIGAGWSTQVVAVHQIIIAKAYRPQGEGMQFPYTGHTEGKILKINTSSFLIKMQQHMMLFPPIIPAWPF